MKPVFVQLLQLARPVSKALFSARKPLVLRAALACAISISAPAFAISENLGQAVGEVTMFLGEAYIIQADGEATPVSVGATIRVADTIETSSGGLVHIRFTDNQLVAVRSYSSLEIVDFVYDPQAPQNSVIKLDQQEGVNRYISGKGAKSAKQNFRLNTPIAAIGVRGTNFVVSANETSMRALVNEGAIVVAPYSSMCSAAALGPCSQDAVELSSLSQQILEMNTSTAGATTALLPANPQAQQALADAASAVPPPTENKEKTGNTDIYTDTVTSRAVNVKLASSVVKNEPPVVVVPREFTPDVAVAASALTTNTQLVWGRWSESNLEYERITVPYLTAIEEGRSVGPGNFPAHVLFRVENGSKVVAPNLGVLKFDLTQAQAHYNTGGAISLMDVLGGNLQMDFEQNRFVTDLQLSHAATGKIEFRDGGFISDGGYFSSVSDVQSMAGAISLDGKEAGYFFEKTLDNASIEGLTLWGQKP